MYCLKCKYTSFDHLDTCPKCGHDWNETKKALNLDWLPPPPETQGTEQVAEQKEEYSEEELELNSDHFLLDNEGSSGSGEQSVPDESLEQAGDIEEIEYPEIDLEESGEDLQLSNVGEEPQEPGEQPVQSVEQGPRDAGPDITGEDSEDISHPDLEQLLDSYSMDSAPDTSTSESEQEMYSSVDLDEELELFGDLEMDEEEKEVGPGTSNTDSESTSGERDDEQDKTQDEEIDITSILDNPEDYRDGDKK